MHRHYLTLNPSPPPPSPSSLATVSVTSLSDGIAEKFEIFTPQALMLVRHTCQDE